MTYWFGTWLNINGKGCRQAAAQTITCLHVHTRFSKQQQIKQLILYFIIILTDQTLANTLANVIKIVY